MSESPGAAAPRRRRKASSQQVAPAAKSPQPTPKRRRSQRQARDSGERGMPDLVGGGESQLGVSGALRGRDVNRPTEQDLSDAERDVVIVRRNWKPN